MKKRFNIPEGPFRKYDYLLISKFSTINRKTRLTFKRFARIKIEKKLLKAKKDLLTEILYNRKAALAWDFTYYERVKPEIVLLQKIKIIPHEAWQMPSFPISRALKEKVIKILNNRIKRNILKRSESPYRNP
jgi:hypothetical protein